MYYNTTSKTGKDLKRAEKKAETQKEIILKLFKEKKMLSASQAWNLFTRQINKSTPLTSIRRAITDLMNENYLKKTSLMNIGVYGDNEHIYMLNIKEINLKAINAINSIKI